MTEEGPIPIVLAGPTASGKSALAVALAERLGGELICGDSRQVYEGMRVGAAGPEEHELTKAPHHGYHQVSPDEAYDAGRYLADTDGYVAEVLGRRRTPIIVGGSGLYLRAWRYGLRDVPKRDPEVRARLDAEIEAAGPLVLYERLRTIDEVAARGIEPKDGVRIVRALEIWELTGKRPSELRTSHGEKAPRVSARWLLVDASLEWLTPRLERRARAMFEGGLLEEAAALVARTGESHRLLTTMGYEEAWRHVKGELSLEAAIALTVKRQRQYARRQRTWFRKEPWWEGLHPETAPLLEQALRFLAADRA